MKSDNFYLLTFLAELDRLTAPPQITPEHFLETFDEDCPAKAVARVLFIADDLMQRQAFLAGEINSVEPLVLTSEMCRDDQPLPDELIGNVNDTARKVADDIVWEAYFRLADKIADESGIDFLKKYIGFEVALRNALVDLRAESLGLEPGDYYIARDLQQDVADFSAVLTEWSSTVGQNPLKAQQVLDEFRWNWIEQNGKYFSFANDELAAYAAKLTLSWRWKRLSDAENE